MQQSGPVPMPYDHTHTTAKFAMITGGDEFRLWGMSVAERNRRLLHRAGMKTASRPADASRSGAGGTNAQMMVLDGSAVLDPVLVQALRHRADTVLVVEEPQGARAVAACLDAAHAAPFQAFLAGGGRLQEMTGLPDLSVVRPDELAGAFNAALRKREMPLARIMKQNADSAVIERELFAAAYKGVTDIITKFVWPRPAFYLTRWAAKAGISPNMVTSLSLLCSIAVFISFTTGHFAAGLGFGWAMALLDTVDGKLARVTLTSSRWGNVFDHGIDLVAPPLWWLGWWLGMPGHDQAPAALLVVLVLGGHIAGKLVEQAFITLFGFKIHMWTHLDSRFRLITARRNPNLAILSIGLALATPLAAYTAMAIWIIICLLFHFVRLLQALDLEKTGRRPSSWLAG
jgi:phosphatidylglycerophosphate synthase